MALANVDMAALSRPLLSNCNVARTLPPPCAVLCVPPDYVRLVLGAVSLLAGAPWPLACRGAARGLCPPLRLAGCAGARLSVLSPLLWAWPAGLAWGSARRPARLP
eukprot:2412092-Alexandrium_andersonii.AAC.1